MHTSLGDSTENHDGPPSLNITIIIIIIIIINGNEI